MSDDQALLAEARALARQMARVRFEIAAGDTTIDGADVLSRLIYRLQARLPLASRSDHDRGCLHCDVSPLVQAAFDRGLDSKRAINDLVQVIAEVVVCSVPAHCRKRVIARIDGQLPELFLRHAADAEAGLIALDDDSKIGGSA